MEGLPVRVRSTSLFLMPACVWVGIVMIVPAVARGPKIANTKTTPKVVCRFKLGAVFQSASHKYRDAFLNEFDLDLKQVVKAFDQRKLTVVVKPAHSGAKPVDYDQLELKVKGDFKFNLKDSHKHKVALDVTVKLQDVLQYKPTSKTPTRFTFNLLLQIEGAHTKYLLGLIEVKAGSGYWMSSDYGCDANGNMFDPAKLFEES
jgi:hypothetical protein